MDRLTSELPAKNLHRQSSTRATAKSIRPSNSAGTDAGAVSGAAGGGGGAAGAAGGAKLTMRAEGLQSQARCHLVLATRGH